MAEVSEQNPGEDELVPLVGVKDDRTYSRKEASNIVHAYRARDKFYWHEDWEAWCRDTLKLSNEQIRGIVDAS